MIVFLEDGKHEFCKFQKGFKSAGSELIRFGAIELLEYVFANQMQANNLIEAVIINAGEDGEKSLDQLLQGLAAPVVVLVENRDLVRTKAYFQRGVDDVVLKPVHHEELLLRIATIKRRILRKHSSEQANKIHVFFDGRDPEYNGVKLNLPRRERKILEYLAFINGRRATKSQIFDAVYGIDLERYDETIVEPHICKLRKRLKAVTGFDPINSVRFLGYQLDPQNLGSSRKISVADAA